ncbi:MAG: hypothetical protein ACYTF1_00615 [Planctomycetota bacterium]
MKRYVIVMVVAILAYGSVAQADTLVIQDLTPDGSDPGVQDAELQKPLPIDIYGRGCPDCGDRNGGASEWLTLYSDGGPFQHNGIGPHHQLFKFDTYALEQMTVNSAEFVFNIHPRRNRKSCCIPIDDLKLSRLLPGNDWIEGDQDGDEAYPGEVTWNSRKHNLNPPWFPPGGATFPGVEIDVASTITFPPSCTPTIPPSDPPCVPHSLDGLRKGEIRKHTVDVTEFVQAWAGGVENCGMVMWGGYVPEAEECEKHFILFSMKLAASETQAGEKWYKYPDDVKTTYYTVLEDRPALVVDFDPLQVDVDILPHDDPNLFTVNTQGKGRLPIEILASEDYDISKIDVTSISIAGVVFPVTEPKIGDSGNLQIKISRRALILALGLDLLDPGTLVDVSVEGTLVTGGPFVGSDSIVLEARGD